MARFAGVDFYEIDSLLNEVEAVLGQYARPAWQRSIGVGLEE